MNKKVHCGGKSNKKFYRCLISSTFATTRAVSVFQFPSSTFAELRKARRLWYPHRNYNERDNKIWIINREMTCY